MLKHTNEMTLRCARTLSKSLKLISRRNASSYRSSDVILGIETSCDDTAVALVSSNLEILENIRVANRNAQNNLGGICPSVSADQHRSLIDGLVSECLQRRRIRAADLRAVAVSDRPGLVICLKAGLDKALSVAREARLHLIPVHHMRAHAMTPFLTDPGLEFPIVCLLVSGGHSLLCLAHGPEDFEVFGESISGSPGETLDKIGRELRLHEMEEFSNMHLGSAIEILAARSNDVTAYPLKQFPQTHGADVDFLSIKNMFLTMIHKSEAEIDIPAFCASLQFSIAAHLCAKLHAGLECIMDRHRPRHLVISGGVASNQYIFRSIAKLSAHYELETIVPPPNLCTDNAAMIAAAAWKMIEHRSTSVIPYSSLPQSPLYAHARVPIGENRRDLVAKRPQKRLSLKSVHGENRLAFFNNGHNR